MDEMDEKQIVAADEEVKQAMAYTTKDNKKQLTYIGLKHMLLKMSQGGQPLEIKESEVNLERFGSDDQSLWVWYAKCVTKNTKTGHETVGLSEAYYLERNMRYENGKPTGEFIIGKYDPFGRTKAFSKAERNSWRKQIPELEIVSFLKSLDPESIQHVDEPPKMEYCSCGETGIPDKYKTRCVECKGVFNELQRKVLGLDK